MKNALTLLLLTGNLWAEQQDWRDRFRMPRRLVLDWAEKDPNKILFTTNQSGAFQLYFYDLKSKKLIPLTRDSADQDKAALSPDGESALSVKTDAKTSRGQIYRISLKKGRVSQQQPIADFLDKIIGDVHWGQGGRNIYFVASGNDGFFIYRYRLKNNTTHELFRSTLAVYGIFPSRDERYLAFLDGQGGISILDLETKQIKTGLSTILGALETSLAWAREGNLHRLLVTSSQTDFVRPGIFYPDEARIEWLPLSLNGDIAPVDWLPGSKEILLIQTDQAKTHLWRYSPETKKSVVLFLPGGFVDLLRVRPNGDLWLEFQSSEKPPDQYLWSPKTTELKPLLPDPLQALFKTRQLKGYPVKNVETVSWDGTRIQGWLLKPSLTSDAKRSGVIFLHDGPLKSRNFVGNVWDPMILALVDHGYVVICLNYRGSRGFGREFETQIVGNPGLKELEDINAARDYLIREENVDRERVVIAGGYYGGYLSLMSLTRYPHLWAAGYVFNAIADFLLMHEEAAESLRNWCRWFFGATAQERADLYFDRSPIAQVDQIQAPILIIQEEEDLLTPKRQMDDFVENLKVLKKKNRYITFKAGLGNSEVEERIKFTEELLKFLHEQGLGPAPF